MDSTKYEPSWSATIPAPSHSGPYQISIIGSPMNEVFANEPVRMSAPVVPRDSFMARAASQKKPAPRPNSSHAMSATSTSFPSGRRPCT